MTDRLATYAPRQGAVQSNPLGHWFAIAGIAALALALQFGAYPNHDVAWILWGTRELLQGAAWGRDIIEPNPPLAWYIAMPSTWLADLLGLPLAAAFQLAVGGAALLSIAAFGAFARQASGVADGNSRLPMLVAALALLLLASRDFGQREHLALIAVLPYVGLVALRCQARSVTRATALAIGVAAGLGIALKPYFLAVPLLVEVTALLIVGRWGFTLRAETAAIAGTIGIYVLSLILVDRDYLTEVVPLAQSIYWSFNLPWEAVIMPLAPSLAVAAFAGIAAWPQRLVLPLLLVAAVIGFALSCIVQHKGYSYHVYPVLAGALIVVATLLVSPALTKPLRGGAMILLALLALQGSAITARWWRLNAPDGQRTLETRALTEAIDRHAGKGRFLAVAVHPFPAFPTALYVDATQVSRTNSQWFLPAVIQLRAQGARADQAMLASAEHNARAFILRDLARAPDLVILDRNSARHTVSAGDFDFLAFYREDPRFRAAWASYREIAPVSHYRLFVRRREARH